MYSYIRHIPAPSLIPHYQSGFRSYSDAASGPLQVDDIGIIVGRKSSSRWQVRASNGKTWYYDAEALVLHEPSTVDISMNNTALMLAASEGKADCVQLNTNIYYM